MKLNDETRTRLFVEMTLTADPTGSTLEVKIDGTWLACEWQGEPVKATKTDPLGRVYDEWKQSALTVKYFAGSPGAALDGDVVVSPPRDTETRVSWPGGNTIVHPSSPIDVD